MRGSTVPAFAQKVRKIADVSKWSLICASTPVSSKFGYPQIWVSGVPIFTKKWVPPYPYFQKYRYPRTYIYGKYEYPCGNMGIPILLNWLLRSGASGLKWQSRGGMGRA